MIAMIAGVSAVMAAAQTDPPAAWKTPPTCVCPADNEKGDVVFEGIPFDAQLVLSEDGRHVDERQATLFHVAKKLKGDLPADVEIWHVTYAEKCGVRFVYGRRYTVRARTVKAALETNSCLVKDAAAEKQPS